MRSATFAATAVAAALACACGGGGGGSADAAPACGQACQDAVALLALRLTIKVAYNVTLQGNPVGDQDSGTRDCPLGGTASVSGHATSNASQGATMVSPLTYVFTKCRSSNIDTDPTQVFDVTVTGTITERGTIAVQPSSTTALTFHSESMTLSGTVYSPAIGYEASDAGSCVIKLGQDGNNVSGTLCGRHAGVAL